ncbi:MAG TPA: SDR family oxidoreductase [Xanthomonadales bacterium]|nr:SDR family oxidoreductase [Xanthomonadales bacterium]
MQRVLVTGANRGLGLEFVKQLLARGERVFAACRKPGQAHELTKLAGAHPGRLSVLPFDAAKPASAAELAREIAMVEEALDIAIGNAGMLPGGERFGELDAKVMNEALAVNCTGQVMLAQAVAPLLEKGRNARLVTLSTIMASIASRTQFRSPSYCASKAALNMATRLVSFELAPRGITTFCVHPGWVKTDMGGAGAEITATESVTGLLRLIDGATPAQTGCFLDWQGREIPW